METNQSSKKEAELRRLLAKINMLGLDASVCIRNDMITLTRLHGKSNEAILTIPYGVECIDKNMFTEYSFEDIILPDTLKEIGDGCFKSCNNVERIIFPESLRKIGKNAFNNCNNLKSISLYKKTKMDKSAFSKCNSLDKIIVNKSANSVRKKKSILKKFKLTTKSKVYQKV